MILALVDARRLRRQRNLERVEIPEGDVTLTDELLGKGGFGAVYIADYNGRNAAAKVRANGRSMCVLGKRILNMLAYYKGYVPSTVSAMTQ